MQLTTPAWNHSLSRADAEYLLHHPQLLAYLVDPIHNALPADLPPGTSLLYIPTPPPRSTEGMTPQQGPPASSEDPLRKVGFSCLAGCNSHQPNTRVPSRD